jgi:sec-independent protein translocase protein TatA
MHEARGSAALFLVEKSVNSSAEENGRMDPIELVIIGIIVVVIVVMGPKRIPELARALGSAKKEFNAGAASTPVSTTATMSSEQKGGGDDLMVAARKLGISTEGKTREQISAEIVRKTAGT